VPTIAFSDAAGARRELTLQERLAAGARPMQLLRQEIEKVTAAANAKVAWAEVETPVQSVGDLAARHGVKMDEVRHFTERILMTEEDPIRMRRVRDLARSVADGRYRIDHERIVDMVDRRIQR
jgi:anti-sigma28 factor (negative regulator of flagellin synthesis)